MTAIDVENGFMPSAAFPYPPPLAVELAFVLASESSPAFKFAIGFKTGSSGCGTGDAAAKITAQDAMVKMLRNPSMIIESVEGMKCGRGRKLQVYTIRRTSQRKMRKSSQENEAGKVVKPMQDRMIGVSFYTPELAERHSPR